MRIAIGSDHRGRSAMTILVDRLREAGHDVQVVDGCDAESIDYPIPASVVARQVAGGGSDRGILFCGTGIGVTIAANKIAGVRAALVQDELSAEMSRSHNNANVLCMSADLLSERLIEKITMIFLDTPFSGGRHERRIRRIEAIERGEDPALLEVSDPQVVVRQNADTPLGAGVPAPTSGVRHDMGITGITGVRPE